MGRRTRKVSRPLRAARRRATLRVQGAPGRVSGRRGAGVRHGIGHGRRGFRAWDATLSAVAGALAGFYVGTSRRGRRRVSESRRRGPESGRPFPRRSRPDMRTELSTAAWLSAAERLRCCATRPLREGGKADVGLRREGGAPRAARRGVRMPEGWRGALDQLLESLAHADQLDPLDVEGILALRSISERCAERIGERRAHPGG